MKLQTAVDLFIAALKEWKVEGSLTDYEFKIPKQMFDHWEIKTKQMEEEQIIAAHNEGFKKSAEGWNGEYGLSDFNKISEEIGSEQYYNETYGTE